jgi:hypothetical protein
MAALKAAVVVMGVLIVAGFALLVGVLVSRMGGGPAVPVAAMLDEPAGTRITSVAASAERLAVSLQGGGPDRVVVLDLRDGRVLARATLTR